MSLNPFNNMQDQTASPAPRGRGSGRGKRSFRNYGSPSRINKAQDEQNRIAGILKDNEERSRNAPKPSPKVAEYIEKGKQFVSKFF